MIHLVWTGLNYLVGKTSLALTSAPPLLQQVIANFFENTSKNSLEINRVRGYDY